MNVLHANTHTVVGVLWNVTCNILVSLPSTWVSTDGACVSDIDCDLSINADTSCPHFCLLQ